MASFIKGSKRQNSKCFINFLCVLLVLIMSYMEFYVSLETGMLSEILEIVRVQQQ